MPALTSNLPKVGSTWPYPGGSIVFRSEDSHHMEELLKSIENSPAPINLEPFPEIPAGEYVRALRWSSEVPTEEGDYWVKGKVSGYVRCAHIEKVVCNRHSGRLVVLRNNTPVEEYLEETEWAGPIIRPLPSQKGGQQATLQVFDEISNEDLGSMLAYFGDNPGAFGNFYYARVAQPSFKAGFAPPAPPLAETQLEPEEPEETLTWVVHASGPSRVTAVTPQGEEYQLVSQADDESEWAPWFRAKDNQSWLKISVLPNRPKDLASMKQRCERHAAHRRKRALDRRNK